MLFSALTATLTSSRVWSTQHAQIKASVRVSYTNIDAREYTRRTFTCLCVRVYDLDTCLYINKSVQIQATHITHMCRYIVIGTQPDDNHHRASASLSPRTSRRSRGNQVCVCVCVFLRDRARRMRNQHFFSFRRETGFHSGVCRSLVRRFLDAQRQADSISFGRTSSCIMHPYSAAKA